MHRVPIAQPSSKTAQQHRPPPPPRAEPPCTTARSEAAARPRCGWRRRYYYYYYYYYPRAPCWRCDLGDLGRDLGRELGSARRVRRAAWRGAAARALPPRSRPVAAGRAWLSKARLTLTCE
eukprot:scaffold62695_cov70-Phaeocystis_antarctica.AAC.5